MSLSLAPIVAHVIRGGQIESMHHGLGVVTGPDGEIVSAVGDPETRVFARSANKPLQALAMVESGLDVPSDQLALACASHSGEPFHLDVVRRMLTDAGLNEDHLQNTPDLPWRIEARDAWLAAGRGKESVAQNCSGKHAAMLATCVAAGWDLGTYRNPAHPLQQAITRSLAAAQDAEVSAITVDGCGAPVHQLPLVGLARAYGRLAAAKEGLSRRIADAMRTHPDLVGGTDREPTVFMQDASGAIAKDGAEGVFAVGLPSGHGVAVKILDGAARASNVFTAALLERLDLVPGAALERLRRSEVLGHGRPVGAVVAALPPEDSRDG